VRAGVATRLAGQAPAFICTWDSVRSPVGGSQLDLSDPFAETEVWKDVPVPDTGIPDELREVLGYLERPASADASRLRLLAERFSSGDGLALCRRSVHRALDINNGALDLRDHTPLDEDHLRLDKAESLLRIALAIDASAAGRVRKIPHRRNNLATVLLMQGRLREACHELGLAWQSIGTRYDLTSARVLTVRLCAAFVSGGALQPFVGQLKAHLQIRPLLDFSDVTAIWRADGILRAVARSVDATDVEFLRHVVAVLNRANEVKALDRWTVWRESETCPLDRPWPTVDDAVAEASSSH
jgi:hypothetical protein